MNRVSRGVVVVLALVVTLVAAGGVAYLRFGHDLQTYSRSDEWSNNPVRIGTDGRSVVLTYTGGASDASARVDVVQSRRAVRLTIEIRADRGVCSAVGIIKTVNARLDKPLGDRTLVDGACTLDRGATDRCVGYNESP